MLHVPAQATQIVTMQLSFAAEWGCLHAGTYQSTQPVQQILVAPVLANTGFIQAAPVNTAEKLGMQLTYRRISRSLRVLRQKTAKHALPACAPISVLQACTRFIRDHSHIFFRHNNCCGRQCKPDEANALLERRRVESHVCRRRATDA